MLYAGNAFRAPPKRDKKAWATLEELIRGGVKFNYDGGNGAIPKTVKAAKKLRARRSQPTVYATTKPNGKRVIVKMHYSFENRIYRVEQ